MSQPYKFGEPAGEVRNSNCNVLEESGAQRLRERPMVQCDQQGPGQNAVRERATLQVRLIWRFWVAFVTIWGAEAQETEGALRDIGVLAPSMYHFMRMVSLRLLELALELHSACSR